MKSPSIYQIAKRISKSNPHFFSKDTMHFFGQAMNDFSIIDNGDGRWKISAPIKSDDGIIAGKTERYFNPKTNKLELD